MKDQSIVIAGLPSSGKTTFLAALWHMLTAPERSADTALTFDSLIEGTQSHLNEIANCWRNAKTQERTLPAAETTVTMQLKRSNGELLRLTFPDLSGESYRELWEDRTCSNPLKQKLEMGTGILLFINAGLISHSLLTVEAAEHTNGAGLELTPSDPDQIIKWSSRLTPTQIILTDILQLFKSRQLSVQTIKLGIVFSAWDKVDDEELTPSEFLELRLPLLHQYLICGRHQWDWQSYGVSAQGADYHPNSTTEEPLNDEQLAKISSLQDLNSAIERIKVVGVTTTTNDLTEPVDWLIP